MVQIGNREQLAGQVDSRTPRSGSPDTPISATCTDWIVFLNRECLAIRPRFQIGGTHHQQAVRRLIDSVRNGLHRAHDCRFRGRPGARISGIEHQQARSLADARMGNRSAAIFWSF